MGNKKRIKKKVLEIGLKNFINKYKIRVFKRHKFGVVIGNNFENGFFQPLSNWSAHKHIMTEEDYNFRPKK